MALDGYLTIPDVDYGTENREIYMFRMVTQFSAVLVGFTPLLPNGSKIQMFRHQRGSIKQRGQDLPVSRSF